MNQYKDIDVVQRQALALFGDISLETVEPPPKKQLCAVVSRMISNHEKPDLIVRIANTNFSCHKNLLQSYSEMFMTMTNVIVVQLPAHRVSPKAFVMIYDWMLDEQPLLNPNEILEIFEAANFLSIRSLIEHCWLLLDDQRNSEDVAFSLFLKSQQMHKTNSMATLRHLLLTRVCKFFLVLIASEEFLSLTAEELCDLFRSNRIAAHSEIEVFLAATHWLHKDWNRRQNHVVQLLQCVRFALLPMWFLLTLKTSHCMRLMHITTNPEIEKLINDGMTYNTTVIYYGDDSKLFFSMLKRYNIQHPMQRRWVVDHNINVYANFELALTSAVTTETFKRYLCHIHKLGNDYQKHLVFTADSSRSSGLPSVKLGFA